MASAFMILGSICILLLLQYVRMILTIRSLCMQLKEIECGSHIKLGLQSRQRDILALGRQLNDLEHQWFKSQMQYEKAEKNLKQTITSLAHDIRTGMYGP